MPLSSADLTEVIAKAPWREHKLCKASHIDTIPIPCHAEVPEDGFDEDEFAENYISTNWVVRKTFLELEPKQRNSLKMNLRKTDSWLLGAQSTTPRSRLCQESNGSKSFDSNCSTRESSTEDVSMQREKSVRFADGEDMQEVQHLSSTPSVIKFSSLKSDYSAYCGRTRAASHTDDMMPFSNILSIKTEYSPMSGMHMEDGMGFMLNSMNQAAPQTVDSVGTDGDRHHSCKDVQCTQPPVSMSSTVLPMAVPFMLWSPCAVQVPKQATIEPPPGNFSNPIKEAQSERLELLGQQRMLQEQRRRLLSMSNKCSGLSGWKAPTVSHRASFWCGYQEIKHQECHKRIQTEIKPHERTTVILRNLPEGFSRDMIAELLSSQGLAKKFNFIYAPVRFELMAMVGYAFVNFESPEAAEECHSKLEGFMNWGKPSDNVMSVVWSEGDQGLAAIIERHRNSPVMHESVQDEFKPAVYMDGVRRAFPLPTRRIRPPRTQRYKQEGFGEQRGEES